MPNTYTVAFEAQTVAAASGDYDFFELDAAADYPIEVIGIELGQITQEGDTNEDLLRCAVVRGNTTTGNGTAATPQPTSGTGTAQFAAETVSSTPASAGTAVNLWTFMWNTRVGYSLGPLPEGCGFWTRGAALLCVRLLAAVETDLTMSGSLLVVEY